MSLRRSRRFGPAACLSVLALALGGCSLTRPPSSVNAPLPAQWHAPLPAPGASAALPHGGSVRVMTEWWRQLDDPLLVELIDAAQNASPTLASAAARVSEARASSVAAGAALLPNLSGTASASRGNSQFAGTSSFGSAATSSGGSTATPIVTTYQAGLQASWEIDLFGKLRAGRDASSLRLAGADARWHQARVSVAADTANLYFNERACEQLVTVAENDAKSRGETARLTELSMRAGFTAPADAALARASAADASNRLKLQSSQCAVVRAGLVALTGLSASTIEQKMRATPPDSALPKTRAIDSVPAEALAQRPDLYAAELDVAAASASVGEAQRARYPSLSLTGTVGKLQLRTQGFKETLDTWNIGPLQLTVPIFDGGALAANVDAATARYDEAASVYRGNVRQAVREVETALLNLDSTTRRADDANIAVLNYQASLDAMLARYESGLASLLDLETSRRLLITALTARVQLQQERADAWVALYRAMGGGWVRPDGATAISQAAPQQETTSSKSQ
ncbi:efflux transporter outer membrane subunit [Variovorax rhizosphaerae]|uniref:Efflux transporter outer membrane subunit n=1 Tax=Variovorax rhizosphaerae TaxID=1836200 RepID=A0ABU8WIF4_9BURK